MDLKFEKKIETIFKRKKAKDVITAQYDFTTLSDTDKIKSVLSLFNFYVQDSLPTIRILFWEKNETISNFLNRHTEKPIGHMIRSYNGGKTPGCLYFKLPRSNNRLLSDLIQYHFNFEKALNPSLNIRVQLVFRKLNSTTLFDVYDDRGCFFHYFLNRNHMKAKKTSSAKIKKIV